MKALQLTYEILATTRNEAAVDVLLSALLDPNDPNRRLAMQALVRRTDPRAPERLLAVWDKLNPKDAQILRPKRKWITPAIKSVLDRGGDGLLNAIQAANDLGVTDVAPQLILLAECASASDVKIAASNAVVNMAQPLGRDVRDDRGQATARNPVLSRLADSVRRFSMHRNEDMVKAFLLITSWGDADLRQMLGAKTSERELLCKCLRNSTDPGVMELLAGFIRRRNLPSWLAKIITERDDEGFRDQLLAQVGAEPLTNSLRNLREMGRLACCRGGEDILDSVPVHLHAPLAHVYNETNQDTVATLNLVAAVIERGTNAAVSAGAVVLGRSKSVDIDLWMRAAIPVADADLEAIKYDATAKLLKRMIELLSHKDAAVVRGAHQILEPLHADQMLSRFQSLRPRSRRRLGRVVMMVDSGAIDRVKDGLRHPVLGKRMDAIAMADALAVVDLLADSFAHISREDHQEARARAANVMADACSNQTLEILQEMTGLPECQARDAAVVALEKRQTTKSRH